MVKIFRIFKILNLIFKYKVSILRTVFFNFHYFPIADAIKFPVILYKNVRLKKTKGKIIIDTHSINSRRVHIGQENYGFQWKHDYTIWQQMGGTVILENRVRLGKGTFISVGENAILRIEQNACFGGNDRIICSKSITIKANTMVAWDVLIMDTDFHSTINTITNSKNSLNKAIIIGKNNWLCIGCTILKGSITPDYCIVAAKTTINKDFSSAGEYIAIGLENNAKVITKFISYDFTGEINELKT